MRTLWLLCELLSRGSSTAEGGVASTFLDITTAMLSVESVPLVRSGCPTVVGEPKTDFKDDRFVWAELEAQTEDWEVG